MPPEPGHGMLPGGYGNMRASTADRERAIDVLKAAFAEGRLTQDECEQRAGQAFSARTYAELVTLTADLPAGPLGTLVPQLPGYHLPPPSRPMNRLAVASLVLLGAFIRVELRATEPILPLRLFRNSVFAVTNAAGFIIGLALFGSIVFLPQYLQIVKGEGATNSGLLLVPMMVGLLITSIVSGQLISRTGRYKIWPILGTAITVVGLYLLSTMTAATPQVVTAAYMVVLGLGLGGVMQVLVVVVQNSVAQRDIGTATSTATFFRSMGGSIGVPIFGAIFSNVLIAKLVSDLPRGFHLGGLSGGIGNASPQVLDRLPTAIHSGVVHAFAQSLGSVFLAGVPFAVIAFVLVCLIKEVPLRTRIAPMMEGVDESFGVSEGVAVEAPTGTDGASLSLPPQGIVR